MMCLASCRHNSEWLDMPLEKSHSSTKFIDIGMKRRPTCSVLISQLNNACCGKKLPRLTYLYYSLFNYLQLPAIVFTKCISLYFVCKQI